MMFCVVAFMALFGLLVVARVPRAFWATRITLREDRLLVVRILRWPRPSRSATSAFDHFAHVEVLSSGPSSNMIHDVRLVFDQEHLLPVDLELACSQEGDAKRIAERLQGELLRWRGAR
ncbi:MAG: hypothetical protein U0325_14045 [Polyangiales bacterium]